MSKGTVAVNLKRDWFGPSNSLYQVRDNPHEFPAEYAAKPEKGEDESKEDFEARVKKQPYAVLPSSAEVISEGDVKTVAVLVNTANGSQLVTPTIVSDDVKSVGGALDAKGHEKQNLSVAEAEKGADEYEVQRGGVPRKSGPLDAGASDKKK
jgi:hypothetical protein